MISPEPLYSAAELHAAYQLRYGWSAWPSQSLFPAAPTGAAWESLTAQWKSDGLRVLESRWASDLLQITFSASPTVSPVHLASRAKGRLEHFWRTQARTPARFSRKVAVRTIGDNTREIVEQYIAGQVAKEHFADARFAAVMGKFTIEDGSVDLAQATETNSGRYWYNLHVVLVMNERHRLSDPNDLTILRDRCLAIAVKKGHQVSRCSVMPDHIHLAIRGNIVSSPEEISLGFLNNLAFAVGQSRWFSDNYYTGTFSEYNMNAVRPRNVE